MNLRLFYVKNELKRRVKQKSSQKKFSKYEGDDLKEFNIKIFALYFCAEVKEIFSKRMYSFDFFVLFFYQEKNENVI